MKRIFALVWKKNEPDPSKEYGLFVSSNNLKKQGSEDGSLMLDPNSKLASYEIPPDTVLEFKRRSGKSLANASGVNGHSKMPTIIEEKREFENSLFGVDPSTLQCDKDKGNNNVFLCIVVVNVI